MNLIDCFERTYIINLAERGDRRRDMKKELARCGLDVDGRQRRWFRAVRPQLAGGFPSVGVRGCFESHLSIIGEALHDDVDSVLVMEDDLCIDPRVIEAPLQMGRRLHDGDWQFAWLGHVDDMGRDVAAPAWRETSEALQTTHFYAMHRSVLQPLYEYLHACLQRPPGHSEGSPMHVDGAFSLFRRFNPDCITLQSTPSLGWQRSSRSDIHPNRWFDRFALLRPLAAHARSLKNIVVARERNHGGGHD